MKHLQLAKVQFSDLLRIIKECAHRTHPKHDPNELNPILVLFFGIFRYGLQTEFLP